MHDPALYGPRVYKLAHAQAERMGLVKPVRVVRADWLEEVAPGLLLDAEELDRSAVRLGREQVRRGPRARKAPLRTRGIP